MTATPAALYETLCELAERELELVGDGSFDRAGRARRAPGGADRHAALAPRRPPPAQPSNGARCSSAGSTSSSLRAREALMLELSAVARGQRAASGYKPPNLALPRVTASA